MPEVTVNFLKWVKPIFINRYVWIVLVSLSISFFIITHLRKYTSELLSTTVSSEYYSYCYSDLDQDGNSEKLQFISSYNDLTGLIVYQNDKIIEQWNFTGEKATSTSQLIDDFDQDGIKEIFIFTVHKDSVYLNCVDAINRKIKFQNKAISKALKDSEGEFDIEVYPCSCFDVNDDGIKEIFFSIRSNFATYPRNMFAFYPAKDSVYISPESCSLILEPEMKDLDGDCIPEFMAGRTHATGNCNMEREYSDQFSWLMVFTSEMKFRFTPVSFSAYPSITRFIPLKTTKGYQILTLHVYQGQEDHASFLALYDLSGKLIRKKNLNMPESWVYSAIFSDDDDFNRVYILRSDGRLYSVDSLLTFRYKTTLKNNQEILTIDKMDIDGDGKNEFLLPGKIKGELLIYRNDLSNPVILQAKNDISANQISLILKAGKAPEIFINNKDYLYTHSYKPTLIYKYRFLLFIPILLLILFFDYLIRVIRNYQALKIDQIQNQISELQIKSVQNQLDPHFTFNIFSSFSNLINEKDTERANYIFDRYAGLLKASIINSENVSISLREELDFVASYLELEKFRYSDRFSFQINLDENIDVMKPVPKMLVHIFVENAIKHGIRHLPSAGMLKIDGIQNEGTIMITINDNGIGRQKAKEFENMSTGKGLIIVNAIIESYNKLYHQNISFRINDLYEHGQASGTEVQIKIPNQP